MKKKKKAVANVLTGVNLSLIMWSLPLGILILSLILETRSEPKSESTMRPVHSHGKGMFYY